MPGKARGWNWRLFRWRLVAGSVLTPRYAVLRRFMPSRQMRIDLSSRMFLGRRMRISPSSLFPLSPSPPLFYRLRLMYDRQFGNLLVLQAASQSPTLKSMVPPHVLAELFQKTIYWLQTLSPISSALRHDAQILENAAAKLDFQISTSLGRR